MFLIVLVIFCRFSQTHIDNNTSMIMWKKLGADQKVECEMNVVP